MPMHLAVDTHPSMTANTPAQPVTNLPSTALLDEGEADRLLSQLVHARWSRLSCQDTDPLGMLFDDRARQWTMGWEPDQAQSLLLLTWETDSWQNQPVWSLYRNGQLIFQAVDGPASTRRKWLTQLLESPHLPTMTPTEFLARLSDFRYVQDTPQAVEQLRLTAAVYPDAMNAIKDALLNLLEAELGNPEWPTLEVLKVHRLSHKNPIISLFQDWVQQGKIKDASDVRRLQHILSRLQQDYLALGQTINPLFQGTYQQAYQEFRSLQTTCNWRLHLLKTLPNSLPVTQTPARPVSSPSPTELEKLFLL
jgi:hypothetical protein